MMPSFKFEEKTGPIFNIYMICEFGGLESCFNHTRAKNRFALMFCPNS